MQLRHRLLALGAGGTVVTAVVLFAVGAVESGQFSGDARSRVANLSDADRNHVAEGVLRLAAGIGGAVQASVNRAQQVAITELGQRGGMQLSGPGVTWQATNQLTQQSTTVTLPRVLVGGAWLGQNRDPGVATPFVDDVRAMVGGTVTLFQRMNAAGDLLRVATNVPNRTGQRAIGTYIPAVGTDGQPNAVAAAIREGKPYRGVAQVVDTWYVTGYDPVRDAAGNVIGAIYFGVPQAEAIASLVSTIAETRVGEHGSVTVYSTGATDRGRVIAAGDPAEVGQNRIEALDADGVAYVDQITAEAPKLADGETYHTDYSLPGLGGAAPARGTVTVAHYAPYRWAIVTHAHGPDVAALTEPLDRGRMRMLLSFAIGALVLAGLFGGVAWYWANRLSGQIGGLTGALTRLAERDLTVSVPVRGNDELARMGTALNTAAGELRGMLGEISTTASDVTSSAAQVATLGQELDQAAATAAGRAGTVAGSARDVSANVRTVSNGSGEMAASIREISENAHEAANVISGIAEQTNLLALNATIEAARAGESGKGFAVVAGEVKDLAQQTAQATGNVTDRVAAIRTDTESAMQAIGAISDAIERVNDFQRAIAAAVEEQTATTEEMRRNVSNASTGSSDIAANIDAVTESVSTAQRSVESSRAAADRLNTNARTLTDLVARFRR